MRRANAGSERRIYSTARAIFSSLSRRHIAASGNVARSSPLSGSVFKFLRGIQKSESYCTDSAIASVTFFLLNPIAITPRSPQQQGLTGQSKDDLAR
jgi:hypothetical protein